MSTHVINNDYNKMFSDTGEYNSNTSLMDISLNNNNNNISSHNYDRRISFSSVSSCHSDSGEDNNEEHRLEPEKIEKVFVRQRSMSDVGTNNGLLGTGDFEIFPSLPDSVLEKLGLKGDGSNETLNEDELEQKFVSLSLAFTIDSTTIKDRCERQRRYRDQTETNLNVEIERLIQRAHRIQYLCVDSETTELLTSLLTQIEIVTKAAYLAQATAEKYGAVQHEERLSDSVNLMVNHVNRLKQQRDAARRQLQYTKRVLQDYTSHENLLRKSPNRVTVPNDRLLTKRRASIATFNQTHNESPSRIENRKSLRRTSEFSPRTPSPLSKNTRPSRLELGFDLVKIREGSVELDVPYQNEVRDETASTTTEDDYKHLQEETLERNISDLPFRENIQEHGKIILKKSRIKFKQWMEDGTLNEICCFCALICFIISLLIMSNIFLEYELAKYDVNPSKILQFMYSGDDQELSAIQIDRKHHNVP